MSKALLEIENGIARITLNSPQNFNALDNTRHPDFTEGMGAFLEKRVLRFGIATETEAA